MNRHLVECEILTRIAETANENGSEESKLVARAANEVLEEKKLGDIKI